MVNVKRLAYEIVMITRNRPQALRLSIPLMLSQSRPPARLLVVDASDDFEQTRQAVTDAAAGSDVPVEVIASARGTSLQRNIGLERVTSPVTMFPDDDALWFPGVAEAMMRVYERDEAQRIGAVCAAESPTPPPGVFEQAQQAYRMTWRDRLKQRVAHQRAAMERRWFPDPFHLHGRSCWDVRPSPAWLVEEDAVLVEWMTGFRMSFRTEVLRRIGFDVALSNYGKFEDVDVSFEVMKTHLVVGARRAQVYHYRDPSPRADGLNMGMQQILNRAYLICKHAPSNSLARRRLMRFSRFKFGLYLLDCHSAYGRDRLRGAWRAMRCVPMLLKAETRAVRERYQSLRERCLNGSAES